MGGSVDVNINTIRISPKAGWVIDEQMELLPSMTCLQLKQQYAWPGLEGATMSRLRSSPPNPAYPDFTKPSGCHVLGSLAPCATMKMRSNVHLGQWRFKVGRLTMGTLTFGTLISDSHAANPSFLFRSIFGTLTALPLFDI